MILVMARVGSPGKFRSVTTTNYELHSLLICLHMASRRQLPSSHGSGTKVGLY